MKMETCKKSALSGAGEASGHNTGSMRQRRGTQMQEDIVGIEYSDVDEGGFATLSHV